MKIGIIGTGSVGRTLAARLHEVGHKVVIGTRNVEEKLADESRDQYGTPPFAEWQNQNPEIPLVTFAEAASYGDVIINATKGEASVNALKQAGNENLSGKIIVDVGNPLDSSKGMPPTLIADLSNTHSLGEEIQMKFPESKVVKTLNTMWAGIMINPSIINNGEHTNFICGNDQQAKETVKSMLKDMGWKEENLMDLGDISASRGTESFLPTWLRILNVKKTGAFNLRIVD